MRRVLTASALAVLLLLVVAACGSSGGSAETPASTPAATPAATDTGTPAGDAATSDGATVFASNCAGCHGTDGSGGSGPDLRNEASIDKVVAQVTDGGANMPAFAGRLSDAEIQSVAEYVTNGFK
ncbi:MAG: cytochrome c [Actinobacteria bacterium]|nr:cytochrome c [Actinomycetota bacterium]